MHDKYFEHFSELKSELIKLDNAYVVGDSFLTLKNLAYDTQAMSREELDREYAKVAKRIYEIQSQLNEDNCQ